MTYSIVARDPETGQLGVAVQTCYWGVGHVVPWAEAGVGAVATQAFADEAYGPRALAALSDGGNASDVLAALVAADAQEAIRQVGVVDARGGVAVHTGSMTIPERGHRLGDGYSVQANMMLRTRVPDAMADTFEDARGDLATRMLAALDAAEAEGGDFRGRMAAALRVVDGDRADAPGHGVVLDVRVDEHAYPLDELRRLVRFGQNHALLERAFDALQGGDAAGALSYVEDIGPELADLADRAFVHALALFMLGRPDDARRAALSCADPSVLVTMVQRSHAAGLLPFEPSTVEGIFGA